MKIIFIFQLLLSCVMTRAQFAETFGDSNLTNNPTWLGDTASFAISPSHKLQSRSAVANSSFKLFTPCLINGAYSWSLDINLLFNTSSLNYVDVFLMSSDSSFTNGYFVRIGNTNDEISLYKKTGNSVSVLMDGLNGALNSSSNSIRISITRNNLYTFCLNRSVNGGAFITEGIATDSSFRSGNYFGVLIKQSTSSFFNKHEFDNIIVQPLLPDTTAPTLDSFALIHPGQLDLFFNEPIDSASLISSDNIRPVNWSGYVSSIEKDSINAGSLHVFFANDVPSRTPLLLEIRNLTDAAGNIIEVDTLTFIHYEPAPYDVVIDEIMADPSPSVRLPECEWIELRNRSSLTISLKGWYLIKNGFRSGLLPDYSLKPDSLVVLCSTGSYDTMKHFARCIPIVNFPALTNTGDLISLRSNDHQTIHAVKYSTEWYKNAVKENGGWSLEMIDINNPCSGMDNWSASADISGASPGKINSNNTVNPDQNDPDLLHAFATDSLHVWVYFNEPLDSASTTNPNNYQWTDNAVNIINVSPLGPLFDRVNLTLGSPLVKGKIYDIHISGIRDCAGNSIGLKQSAKAGLTEKPKAGDVVINEILFNPKPGGYDYVEIYNRSQKLINLEDLRLADHDVYNQVTDISELTEEGKILFPGEYLVLTEGASETKRDYFVRHPEWLISMKQIPSFNDDEGCVLLLDDEGQTIDHVPYKETQHMELLDNREGVALERISPETKSYDINNWHSASFTSGYGTPTQKNSQYLSVSEFNAFFTVEPSVFTPDNDGRNDVLILHYSFSDPGYLLTATVYDVRGRLIFIPANGILCGNEGNVFWNGKLPDGTMIKPGVYVVYTEAFQKSGKKQRGKKSFVVR